MSRDAHVTSCKRSKNGVLVAMTIRSTVRDVNESSRVESTAVTTLARDRLWINE
jgi:hypothetical protein